MSVPRTRGSQAVQSSCGGACPFLCAPSCGFLACYPPHLRFQGLNRGLPRHLLLGSSSIQLFSSLVSFDTRSHYVVQAAFQLVILLPPLCLLGLQAFISMSGS